MDIPGLATLTERILSQCGIISGVFIVAIVWLALRLVKTMAAWQEDRASMLKLYDAQNDAYEKLAVAHAEIKGMLLAVQARAK